MTDEFQLRDLLKLNYVEYRPRLGHLNSAKYNILFGLFYL